MTETLLQRYERVSRLFIWGDNPEDERYKKYRERLLGPDLIAAVPERYNELSIIEKVGYENWIEMSLSERGEFMAFSILSNMAEVIREHTRLQKDIQKEVLSKKGRSGH